jgi:nucleotide-binding universal stress UspA family protein
MTSFRHVVTAVDLAGRSPSALAFGATIARTCGARLSVLHVHPYSLPDGTEAPLLPLALPLGADERAHIESDLAARVEPARPGIPEVDLVVREGDAAREIVAYAAASDADLIVVGTHARRGLDRLVLGSIAERVARKASASVLAVREFGEGETVALPTLLHLLCTIDRMEDPPAISIAAALARATGGRLTVLHVIDGHGHAPWPLSRSELDHARAALAESAHLDLARLLARHVDPGQSVDTLVTFGTPRTEISRITRERAVDLVVLGAPAPRRIGAGLFPSTLEHVLRTSACPTLVARGGRLQPAAHPREEQPHADVIR